MTDHFDLLKGEIRKMAPLLIAYSGGVDSSFLAAVAKETIPGQVRFVLLDSPLLPRRMLRGAFKIADELGIDCEVVPFPILDDDQFRGNPPDRCGICKRASSRLLKRLAGESRVADGANTSDLGEYRPGLTVSGEEGILHPFIEAGMSKRDIREGVHACGLSFWNKPSAACLATRIPYGEEVTQDTLRMIEGGEEVLSAIGFSQFRLRVHGNLARIEVMEEELDEVIAHREEIIEAFRSLGLLYVTLDLAGFRSGSMDEVL
jgi:uncharacterized protein